MQDIVKINGNDNVAVALRPITKGETLDVAGEAVTMAEDIPQGHKFALRPIQAGEEVVKYGFRIGYAKEDIQTGQWVHVHNVKTALGDILSYTYEPTGQDVKPTEHAYFQGYRRTDGKAGVRNEIILQNLKKLAASGVPYILRIPVIPGFNDSQEVIDSMGDFILEEMGNTPVQVQLLRFRHRGEEKRESLGLENLMEGVDPDRAEFEERIRGYVERLAARGIPAVAGSTKKLD